MRHALRLIMGFKVTERKVMKLEDIRTLKRGSTIYSNLFKDKNGSPCTATVVSGRISTDARGRPSIEVRRNFFAKDKFWLSHVSVDLWQLTEAAEEPPHHHARPRPRPRPRS